MQQVGQCTEIGATTLEVILILAVTNVSSMLQTAVPL